jgi:hypothetical protein
MLLTILLTTSPGGRVHGQITQNLYAIAARRQLKLLKTDLGKIYSSKGKKSVLVA